MLTPIFISGLSGVVAQVLILRELLVGFYGNELTLGVILANWIISEAAGVISMGKIIERIKDRARIFIILVFLFCFSLPCSLYFARVFKIILGLPLGQGLSIFTIFWVSLAINFFPAFFHGTLFSAACKIYASRANNQAGAVSKMYAFEALGTAFGGVMLTYIFLPFFNYFQIAFAICIVNFITCSFVADYVLSGRLKNYIISLTIIFSILLILIGPSGIERFSLGQKYSPGKLLHNQNSVYGNIAVVANGKQRTFYYDGLPLISTPYPDINFVEDFGNLAMLFHNLPKNVLLISGGPGGLIYEILKHPLVSLDYLEIDPALIRTLRSYPSGIINNEFKDKRLHIIAKDGRQYLKQVSNNFDLILIGMPYPLDLANNRFFTEEFFRQASKKLKPQGIIALTLPGSLSYLSPQLRDLNSCVYYAITGVFKYVRLIPGDYNLILASLSQGIFEVDAGLILRRIKERNLKTNILNPGYLSYRLDYEWVRWYSQSSRKTIRKVNRDFAPFAVFKMTDYWNKKFSPRISALFGMAQNLNFSHIITAILFIAVLMLWLFKTNNERKKELALTYVIGTTGFFGMLINLVLVFGFQIISGYLYYKIGLLIGIFMSGIALGSIFESRFMRAEKNPFKRLIFFEAAIITFSACTAGTLQFLSNQINVNTFIFAVFFFCAGWLMGAEFSLAAKICLSQDSAAGQISGKLYFADLLGGWLAGILTGILFLPVLGITLTCAVVILLKASSSLLVIIANGGFTKTFSKK